MGAQLKAQSRRGAGCRKDKIAGRSCELAHRCGAGLHRGGPADCDPLAVRLGHPCSFPVANSCI
jgi:hypothetical protein